jgi:hypothetical protein
VIQKLARRIDWLEHGDESAEPVEFGGGVAHSHMRPPALGACCSPRVAERMVSERIR